MPSLREIQERKNQQAIDKAEAAKAAATKERAANIAKRKVEKAIATKRERLMGETICNAMKLHELSHDEIRVIGRILARRKDIPQDWDLLDDFPRAVAANEIKPAAAEFSRTGK
jgi:hypothetical protein